VRHWNAHGISEEEIWAQIEVIEKMLHEPGVIILLPVYHLRYLTPAGMPGWIGIGLWFGPGTRLTVVGR
jgi:hypothetical protein